MNNQQGEAIAELTIALRKLGRHTKALENKAYDFVYFSAEIKYGKRIKNDERVNQICGFPIDHN